MQQPRDSQTPQEPVRPSLPSPITIWTIANGNVKDNHFTVDKNVDENLNADTTPEGTITCDWPPGRDHWALVRVNGVLNIVVQYEPTMDEDARLERERIVINGLLHDHLVGSRIDAQDTLRLMRLRGSTEARRIAQRIRREMTQTRKASLKH